MSAALTRIYENSPAFVQNLGISLYGLRRYVQEHGRGFAQGLGEYEERARWSAGELEDYQNERLRQLIRHCQAHVPYYRDLMAARKLAPDDLRTVGDLPKLPVLTPDDVDANFDRLIASTVRRSALIAGHTSGTTGTARTFLYDRQVCRAKSLVAARHKRWGGIGDRDRTAIFFGKAIVPLTRTRAPFWRHNWTTHQLYFSAFHVTRDTMPLYVQRLADFTPLALEGYPSQLYLFAEFLLRQNRTIPVAAAFTTSEILLPAQRVAISRAFCCPVFDYYGLAERTMFATECEAHQGLHLNTDFGITELVTDSGSPAAPGELGRIVATGLHNYAMPLLRYQTSDLAALEPQPCACGRGFPLVTRIVGRREDLISTPDGRVMDASVLYDPFARLPSIRASQVLQEDVNHLRVRIVRGPDYADRDSRFLLDELHRRLGSEMHVELEFVDSLPRTNAGKFRWLTSRIKARI